MIRFFYSKNFQTLFSTGYFEKSREETVVNFEKHKFRSTKEADVELTISFESKSELADAQDTIENLARFEAQKFVDENQEKFQRFLSISTRTDLNCLEGYFLNSQNICEDVDECQEGRCHSTAHCENTVGSYECSCNEGFNFGANLICQDINECKNNAEICPEDRFCHNIIGRCPLDEQNLK